MTTRKKRATPVPEVRPEMEEAVGTSVPELATIYAFDRVRGFGPQKYKQLSEEGVDLASVLADPDSLPLKGKRGDTFRDQIRRIAPDVRAQCADDAKRQVATAYRLGARILTYRDPAYPPSVYASNNPIPALYVRGALDVLKADDAIACVGSRGIRPPYDRLQAEFARSATKQGLAVVSGFALGADSIAHTAGREAGGRTICCMPCVRVTVTGCNRPPPNPTQVHVWIHGWPMSIAGAISGGWPKVT